MKKTMKLSLALALAIGVSLASAGLPSAQGQTGTFGKVCKPAFPIHMP